MDGQHHMIGAASWQLHSYSRLLGSLDQSAQPPKEEVSATFPFNVTLGPPLRHGLWSLKPNTRGT